MRSPHVRTPALLAAALVVAATAAPATAASRIHQVLEPCRPEGLDEDVLCGTYPVWEDREARSGRKIGLAVVVLPAEIENPRPDPLFFFHGGPGAAATSAAAGFARGPEPRQRDLVLIDLRGTGGSNGLTCAEPTGEDSVQELLDEYIPPEVVRRCARELSERADLALYTTTAAIDDADEVRRWLGYPRINLLGVSGGTLSSLVYLRRHPEAVRSAVLMAVVPTSITAPLWFARDAQRALDRLFDDCGSEEACRRAYPDPQGDLAKVLERLDRSPLEVEVGNPKTGERETARISRGMVGITLRSLLYQARRARRIPFLLHRAAAGDWEPLVAAVIERRYASTELGVALGYYLAIWCSEGVSYIDPEEVEAATAGTFLGDYMVVQHRAACEIWPHRPVPPSYREPVESVVPVLLLSGRLDPSTPPRWAAGAARHLPDSLHVVSPFEHHGLDLSSPCIGGLLQGFLDTARVEGLDASCAADLEPPPFALPQDD